MKTNPLVSVLLALLLRGLPFGSRLGIGLVPSASRWAVVFQWAVGAVALLGGMDAVSGASTVLTSPNSVTATNGVAFQYQTATAPHGANSFSATPLPTGLSISGRWGLITGTPTETGIFDVQLVCSENNNPNYTLTTNITLTVITHPTSPPSITAQPADTTTTNGSTVSLSVVATGFPLLSYQWQQDGTDVPAATNAALSFTNITVEKSGSYTVVITNSLGSIVSDPATLIVRIPPGIIDQPLSEKVTNGETVTFIVTLTGTSPLTCQWQRNNANIPGATGDALVLTNVTPASAGGYRVIIRNNAGSITSVVATLTVVVPVQDRTRPTVAVVALAGSGRVTNSPVQVTGTARDNVDVARVEYRLNVGAFTNATGTTNWNASLDLVPGTNTVQICALDTSGNRSLTNSRSLFYSLTSPFTVQTNGTGAVTPVLNGHLLEIGRGYTLTATPGAGFLFSNWTGGIVAHGNKLGFLMQSNLTLQANFVPNPFLHVNGNFNGLFYESADVRLHSSGFISVIVGDHGAFSGGLMIGAKRLPFHGQFDLDGGATNILTRPGTNALKVELSLSLTAGSVQISGRVIELGNWQADVQLDRAMFNSVTNPAPFKGAYTLALPGDPLDPSRPGGDGFGVVSIDGAGKVTLAGKLADGSLMAQGVPVSQFGDWPLFVPLYGGLGSLVSWVQFTTNDLKGNSSWIKLSQPKSALYKLGFTNSPAIVGSRYRAPIGATNRVINLTSGTVAFSGGNLAQSFTNNITLGVASRVTNESPNKLTLTITPGTGLARGAVTLPGGTKSISFNGVILQGQTNGSGFFLGTNQSGAVRIEATP